MTPEELQKIIDAVTSTQKAVVNGKIDRLSEAFHKHIGDDAENAQILNTHIALDTRWKADMAEQRERFAPTMQVIQESIGWVRVTMYFLGFCASLATVATLVVELCRRK